MKKVICYVTSYLEIEFTDIPDEVVDNTSDDDFETFLTKKLEREVTVDDWELTDWEIVDDDE